jgi:hypothetical protein
MHHEQKTTSQDVTKTRSAGNRFMFLGYKDKAWNYIDSLGKAKTSNKKTKQ